MNISAFEGVLMFHRPFRHCERSEALPLRRASGVTAVMGGLVPAFRSVVQTAAFDRSYAILAQAFVEVLQPWRRVAAWMAGTGPAMPASAATELVRHGGAVLRYCGAA